MRTYGCELALSTGIRSPSGPRAVAHQAAGAVVTVLVRAPTVSRVSRLMPRVLIAYELRADEGPAPRRVAREQAPEPQAGKVRGCGNRGAAFELAGIGL